MSKNTIRFITENYQDLFTIEDGGKVLFIYGDGTQKVETCKYIDSHHLYVGSIAYHICELAEKIARAGATVSPILIKSKEEERIARLSAFKDTYTPGTRVKLLEMKDELYGPPVGSIGVVDFVDDMEQIHVRWETGSGLALIPDVDSFEILPE